MSSAPTCFRLRHGLDLLELRFARDAALFATTNESESQGSTSPVDWVRHQRGMSGNAAARSIATGEQAAVDRILSLPGALSSDANRHPTYTANRHPTSMANPIDPLCDLQSPVRLNSTRRSRAAEDVVNVGRV
jgi:hypothetical protein